MTTYRDWSITASANTGNAADGFFKENMKYQDVNDAARAMQAILARDRLDKSGTIRTTGTSASYELSVNANLPSLADGDMFVFDAHAKNAGAAELQIKADGTATFSSMAIVNTDLSALREGQIFAGGVYAVVFRSASASSRQFQLLNPTKPPPTIVGTQVNLNGSNQDEVVSFLARNSEGGARYGADEGGFSIFQTDSAGSAQEAWAAGALNGAVTLYFNGSAKLATTNTGIDVTGNVNPTGFFNFGPGTELTISSGAVTATGSYHTIDTESDAASDTLDTINGGSEGDVLIIRANNSARTVVCSDGGGNMALGNSRSLTHVDDTLILFYNGTTWTEISFSDNST